MKQTYLFTICFLLFSFISMSHASNTPAESQPSIACNLSDLVVEFEDCTSDSTYRITINFNHDSTSNVGFDLWANGEFFEFYPYSALPLTIDHFPVAGILESTLVICDNDNLNCCIDTSWVTPDCATSVECDITDLTVEVTCEDSTFTLTVLVAAENASDSFSLHGNATDYGTFAYANGAIILGPFDNGTVIDEMIATDVDDPNCFAEVAVDVDCTMSDDCDITDFTVEVECEDSTFTLTVLVNAENASDSFSLHGNATDYGTFAYANGAIVLGPFDNGTVIDEMIATDVDDPNCFAEIAVDVDCTMSDDCDITDFTVEVECEDSTFTLTVLVNAENASDSFSLHGNATDYGTFAYANGAIVLGPFDNGTVIDEMIATDVDDPNCFAEVAVDVDCTMSDDCDITDFAVEVECEDSTFTLTVLVNAENASDSFSLHGNATDYGTFAYANGAIVLGPFDNGTAIDEMIATDVDDPNCFAEVAVNVDCTMSNDCDITDLTVEVECEDSTFTLTVLVNAENASDSFSLHGNGTDYGTFAYGNGTIVLGPFDNGTVIDEMIATDGDDPNCFAEVAVDVDCAMSDDCDITDLTVEVECEDSTFTLTVLVNAENASDSFSLHGNATDYGTFAYANGAIVLGPFDNGTVIDEMIATDGDDQNCFAEVAVDVDCNNQNDCDIEIIAYDYTCLDASFIIHVMLSYENVGDSVHFGGDGNNYGTYAFDSLIDVGPIPIGPDYTQLIAHDLLNFSCLDGISIDINCFDHLCNIDDLTVISTENVDSLSFDITFDFQHAFTSDSFEVYSGTQFIGTFSYDDLPLTITDFPSRNLPYELLRVCDQNAMSMECCDEIEFMLDDDCEHCKISNVTSNFINCDSIYAFASIDFSIEDGSGQFEIIGNGENYGSFNYSELPVTVQWMYEEDVYVDFIIRDLEDETCLGYTLMEPIDCDGLACEIDDLEVYDIECLNDSVYTAYLDFEYQGTSEGFDVFVDGSFYEYYLYGDLPIVLQIDPSTPVETQILVCDNDGSTCCEDIAVPIPTCISAITETDDEQIIKVANMNFGWRITVPVDGEITVYDMAGRQVVSATPIESTLDISGLLSGAYMIEFKNDNGRWNRTVVFL